MNSKTSGEGSQLREEFIPQERTPTVHQIGHVKQTFGKRNLGTEESQSVLNTDTDKIAFQ